MSSLFHNDNLTPRGLTTGWSEVPFFSNQVLVRHHPDSVSLDVLERIYRHGTPLMKRPK